MNNILIPTTLQKDTVYALKTALSQSEEKSQTIVLMLLRDTPDTASAAFWLRHMQNGLTELQEEILEQCRDMVSYHPNFKLQVHQQFSVSGPLLRNFIEARGIGLVILPNTFRKSQLEINRYCLKLLKNSNVPILQLAAEFDEHQFSKALYIENSDSTVQAKDLPKMIGGHFSFRIISQAKFFDDQNPEEMTPVLYDTIYKNGIDLLIETRKPQKISLSKKHKPSLNENFGLPVLSVCEPVY